MSSAAQSPGWCFGRNIRVPVSPAPLPTTHPCMLSPMKMRRWARASRAEVYKESLPFFPGVPKHLQLRVFLDCVLSPCTPWPKKKERKKTPTNNGDISEFRILFSSLCSWKRNLWSGAHVGQGSWSSAGRHWGSKAASGPSHV